MAEGDTRTPLAWTLAVTEIAHGRELNAITLQRYLEGVTPTCTPLPPHN